MTTRIRILSANEQHVLPVSNGSESANIPIDGGFHPIHDDLCAVLDDSNVQYEIENADATGGDAAAAGAAGLGGSAASAPPRKRKRKSRAKAKAAAQ